MVRCVLTLILVCLLACDSGSGKTAGPTVDPFADIRETFRCSDRHGSEFDISYLDTRGSGHTAVVLIHGFGASVYTWKAVIPALAERYRVVALDLKGFGASAKPDDGRYSVFDQAEVVDALIGHLGIQNVILGGHSMGGTIAMVLASGSPPDRPYRIGKLMIFDAPLFRQRLPLFIMMLDIPVLGEAGLHLIPPKTAVKWVLKGSYFNDGLIEQDEIEAYAAGLGAPGGRKALVRTAEALADLNASGHIFDFDEAKMPALIVWGKKDSVVPPGASYALRDALPGPVTFHLVADCGHIPLTEKPQETLSLIEEFLAPE
jgi:pimeloyl-ACP methyl ester carboxylesterase